MKRILAYLVFSAALWCGSVHAQIGQGNVVNLPAAAGGGMAPCNAFGSITGTCTQGPQGATTYNAGLKADGTDETATLQAALTHCQSLVTNNSGGCNVVIPNGTTGISSALSIGASAVSLTCGGALFGGFAYNEDTGTNADYPCRIKWIGSASTTPFYMLTVQPTVQPARRVIGNNLQGIEYDCNQVVGCGGLLILSEFNATMAISVSNPAPAPYTTNNSSAAAGQVLHFASATGVATGQIVTGVNILSGTYVVSISGGDVTISTTIQTGGVANGATIGFGGEGARFDVSNNGTVHPNDTQDIHLYFTGQNFAGAANLTAPLLVFNGSSQVVSGGHFGNTSSNFVHFVNCLTNNGACVDLNNSDHDTFEHISNGNVGAGPGECIVANGGPGNDTSNGGARYHFFRGVFCGTGVIPLRGTNSGGFISAAFDNKFTWYSTQDAFPTLGAGAITCINSDSSYTWRECNPVGQFGTEADGDKTCTGALTATADLNYRNFTAGAGCALNLSGFRMFVAGLLDLTAAPAGSITCNALSAGHAAAGATGGTASSLGGRLGTIATGTSSGAGGTGGAATSGAGQAIGVTNATGIGYGGDGGAGGNGGASGTTVHAGGTGAVASIITQTRRNRTFTGPGPDITYVAVNATMIPALAGIGGCGGGAGGGDGANAGGGGGAGGPGPGVLELRAFAVARGAGTAAGAIQCLGNVGGAGAAGVAGNAGGGAGGGGSGGGFVYIVAGELTGAVATGAIDVSGGNGGAGGALSGGSGSANGGGGVAGNGGWVQVINLGIASLPTFTASTANTVPSAAPSGTTGGIAATVQVNL